MKKIKLIYICESLGGGVRKHLIDLLNHIDKQKYEIHFIHGINRMDSVFKNEMLKMHEVKFYGIQEMEREINIKKDFTSLKKVISLLKKIKPDIVHCHSSKAGVIGRVSAKLLGIKQVYYTPHGYMVQNPQISQKKRMLYGYIERILAKKFTTKNIHVSRGEAAIAEKSNIVSREKSLVIYNGMDIPSYSKNKEDKYFNIVTIARMDEQKNPWDAIKIVESLLNDYPYIKYTYIGDGKFYNEIVKYVHENNLQDNIILPGFLENPYKVLEGADLFLLTSLYEGLPYSLIEAIAYSVPLLGSDVTGNNEIIINNYNGLLYKLDDIEEAKYKLKSLMDNKDKLTTMSFNAYQHFLDHFTFDKMIQLYDKLYSESMNLKNRR